MHLGATAMRFQTMTRETKDAPTTVSAWTPEAIIDLLMKSDKAVGRALVALLDRQTSDEAASATTKHVNGRGFSAFDAPHMTAMAREFMREGVLKEHTLRYLRTPARGKTPRICAYARQLAEVAARRTS